METSRDSPLIELAVLRGPDETPNTDLAVIDEVDGEACNPLKAQEVENNPDESEYTTP